MVPAAQRKRLRPATGYARVVCAVMALALVALAPASARTGKYGGTLVVGIDQEPGSLDPTIGGSSVAIGIDLAMCLSLYTFAQNHGVDEYVPVLAAAPPTISKDRLTYTIPLRHGILFNDGTPVNAQAVVASVQRFINYPSSTRMGDYPIASVRAAGNYSVVYHLNQRNASFTGNAWVLSPTALATEGANFSVAPVCAGPFMFDHRVVGDNVTLIKSPYWYKRGAVHLDKIVYKVLSDPAAREPALEAGDVQVLTAVPTASVQAIESNPGFRVREQGVFGWQGMFINIGNKNGVGGPDQNVGTPLASSAKLRQAFEEAINRPLLNKVVLSGLDVPMCTPIPPVESEYYSSIKVPCTPYDPADARKLVAASGIPNPTVHVLAIGSLVAQFIQAEEAAVGINVVIDTVDNATSQALRTAGNYDVALGGRTLSSPDPSAATTDFFETGGSLNVSGYSNPRMDYVLRHALEATNPKDRAVYYRVAMQILHEDRPVIVLYDQTSFIAFSTSVTGVEQATSGFVDVVNAQLK